MKTVKLNEVVASVSNPPLSRKAEKGLKVVVPSSIKNGVIDWEKLIEADFHNVRKIEDHNLKNGDILFQAKGNHNKAVLIDQEIEPLGVVLASQSFFVIKVKPEVIDPGYLCWFLNNRVSQAYLERNSTGATIASISKKVLLDMDVVLLSMEEQRKVAQLVQSFQNEKRDTFEYLEKKGALIEGKLLSKIGAMV